MIYFKSKQSTDPGKLASAIAHNIKNSDITISCVGPQAVNAAVKGLIITKKFIQNEPFTLSFDFFAVDETDEEGRLLNLIQVVISKEEK